MYIVVQKCTKNLVLTNQKLILDILNDKHYNFSKEILSLFQNLNMHFKTLSNIDLCRCITNDFLIGIVISLKNSSQV